MAAKRRQNNNEKSLLLSDRTKMFSKPWMIPLCCSLISCLVYLDTLDLGFCFDDHSAIISNNDLRPQTPWSNLVYDDFWGTPMDVEGSHKSYRPLCVLTFRMNYLIHALTPHGYHLVNVVLHGLVTFLFVHYCQTIAESAGKVSLIAGVLFAVHPIHTEAVSVVF